MFLLIPFEHSPYCSHVISHEVFCHEYGKIPRHTGQNPITEGDLEWILTKLLWTEWTATHSPIRVHHFSLFHWLSHDFLSHRVPSLPTFRGPPHDFLSHRVPDFSYSDDFLKSFSSTSHNTSQIPLSLPDLSPHQVTHPHIFYIPSWQIPLWGIYYHQNHHTPTGY